MLNFETEHRLSTLAEFLIDGSPNLSKCWGECPYAFTAVPRFQNRGCGKKVRPITRQAPVDTALRPDLPELTQDMVRRSLFFFGSDLGNSYQTVLKTVLGISSPVLQFSHSSVW